MSSVREESRMKFKAFWDYKCEHAKEDVAEYRVMFNPESFDRTLSFKITDNPTINSSGASCYAGVESETYSFDLIFDGTGVAGPAYPGTKLIEEFRKFLRTVYCTLNKDTKKKEISYVEMTYSGEVFKVELDSMTVKYLLFDSEGNPLRIKASCQFSSVDEPKPVDPEKDKPKKPKASSRPKPVTPETPSAQCCCCPCPTYPETVNTAKENDAVSLMCGGYPRSEMSSYSSSVNGYGN